MTMAEAIKRRYTAVVPDFCPHEPPGRLSREIPNIWQKTNGSDNDDSPLSDGVCRKSRHNSGFWYRYTPEDDTFMGIIYTLLTNYR